MLLVVLGGLFYGFTQLKVNRTASLLSISALGLALFLDAIGIVMTIVTPIMLRNGSAQSFTYTYVWGAYSIVSGLIWALSLLLFLIAIWKKRPSETASQFPPQPDAYKYSDQP